MRRLCLARTKLEDFFNILLTVHDGSSARMQNLSRHVRGVLQCEKHITRRDFFRLARAFQRNIRSERGDFADAAVAAGDDPPWLYNSANDERDFGDGGSIMNTGMHAHEAGELASSCLMSVRGDPNGYCSISILHLRRMTLCRRMIPYCLMIPCSRMSPLTLCCRGHRPVLTWWAHLSGQC